jgi:hypothetical protein
MRRRRAAERVDHDHQLHDVLIDRDRSIRTGRLQDENVGAADVLVDLERDFRVGEPLQPRLPKRHAEKTCNVARQRGMSAAGKYFELAKPDGHVWIAQHLLRLPTL